jgi:hypothetical protein
MARAAITPFTPLGAYPDLPLVAGSVTVVPTAADAANLNAAAFGDAEELLVIALNTDVANTRTITITSVEDHRNRTGDITTYSIAVAPGSGESKIAIFGPFKREGWIQTDKRLYFEASNASVKFIVVKL